MDAIEPIHPTLADLKYEIGTIQVCWSFLEAEMRLQMMQSGLADQLSKGAAISHWRTFINALAIERGPEMKEAFLIPVENAAFRRNLIAHGIHSLSADPWTQDSAAVICKDADGSDHRLTINDLQDLSAEIDRVKSAIMRFPSTAQYT